jgi:hypothetical protein
MNRILLFAISLVCSTPAFTQSPDSLPFPASWTGSWRGELHIYSGRGLVRTVPMALELFPIDTSTSGRYTFGIIYGSREEDWRPYELVPVSPENGLWRVDEKNGIVMESYLYGPRLLCWFAVENNRILCSYEKTAAGELVFEVLSGAETPVSTTGNTRQGEEAIPEVRTFPVAVFQRAVLKKQ